MLAEAASFRACTLLALGVVCAAGCSAARPQRSVAKMPAVETQQVTSAKPQADASPGSVRLASVEQPEVVPAPDPQVPGWERPQPLPPVAYDKRSLAVTLPAMLEVVDARNP